MHQILLIVQRFSHDRDFRAQVQTHPDVALAGYALTAEERALLDQELRQPDPVLSGKPIASVWN